MFAKPIKIVAVLAFIACAISFSALAVNAQKSASVKEKPRAEKIFLKREMLPTHRV